MNGLLVIELPMYNKGGCSRDHTVVGFTTTYATSETALTMLLHDFWLSKLFYYFIDPECKNDET
jgi:hypothetical protein